MKIVWPQGRRGVSHWWWCDTQTHGESSPVWRLSCGVVYPPGLGYTVTLTRELQFLTVRVVAVEISIQKILKPVL